jgi:hypothetical protein
LLDSLLPSGVTLFIDFGCPYKCSVYENELEKTSPFYFRKRWAEPRRYFTT